ncbi:helix-turn-helix domain-containing protein [Spirillospora sp. CA-108201]
MRLRYEAGESVPVIAAAWGLTPRQVYRWMRHERINRRPPGAPMWDEFPISLEELRGWYESGESISGLARELGVSEKAVVMRLAKSGAVLRSREERGRGRRRMELAVPSPVLRLRYEAGESLYDLARALGVVPATVKVRLLEAGTTMRPVGGRDGRNKIELAISLRELRRRREAGESLASLAEELGVCEATIWARLKSAAVELRGDEGRQDGQER